MRLVRGLPMLASLVVFFGLLGAKAAGQTKHSYTIPQPTIGWDSLQARIPYDELLRRAQVEGAFKVTLGIDSAGIVLSYSVGPLSNEQRLTHSDSSLVLRIENGLKGVKWLPATDNGTAVACTLSVPIVFYLTYPNVAQPIVKHAGMVGINGFSPELFFGK
jgi:hypothetical protein